MNSKKLIIILSFSFIHSLTALAEYRAYQYYVSSRYKRADEQKPYLVTSTLDPISYISYHGGNESIKVDLLRTWTCPGYTGELRGICPSPLENSERIEQEDVQ